MPRYAAFLRGINVGGRRVKKEALCTPFEELGHTEVVSFRASGNVIFDAESGRVAALTKAIERELERSLGFQVATMLRTKRQIRAIAATEPFGPKAVAASKGKLQVLLLAKKPTAAVRMKVLELATDADLLAVEGTELYWLPSGGTQESDLDQEGIGRMVGTGTMRTMGTIERIYAKYFT